MANLVDHAAHRGGILERAPPVHLIETEPDQRLLLHLGPPNGAPVLLNRNGLAGLGVRFWPGCVSCHGLASCHLPPLRPRTQNPPSRRGGGPRSRSPSCRAGPRRRADSPAP